jgi:hypothetical protein
MKKAFKFLCWLVFAAFMVRVGWIVTAPPSEAQRALVLKWQRRAGAEALVRGRLAQDQIGLQRVISCTIDDSDEDANQWTAVAVVDFVNHMGGVDRTNLFYEFELAPLPNPNGETNLQVALDAAKMYRQVAEARAASDALRGH